MPFSAGLYYSINEGGNREKPVVVLIHGAGCDHLYWPAELRRLPGYTVLAPDLPGHGRSGGAGQHSIWAYANQVIDFLAELGLYQAIFVGHSLGGCIGLALGLEHPGNVTALGLMSCGAHIEFPPGVLEQAASQATFPLALEAIQGLIFSPYTSPSLVERGVRQLAGTRQGVLYGDLLACKAFDVVDRVGDVRARTLLLTGSDDPLTPPHNAQYLAANLGLACPERTGPPSNQVLIIPGAGHMLPLEQPQPVRSALTAFLRDVCGG